MTSTSLDTGKTFNVRLEYLCWEQQHVDCPVRTFHVDCPVRTFHVQWRVRTHDMDVIEHKKTFNVGSEHLCRDRQQVDCRVGTFLIGNVTLATLSLLGRNTCHQHHWTPGRLSVSEYLCREWQQGDCLVGTFHVQRRIRTRDIDVIGHGKDF